MQTAAIYLSFPMLHVIVPAAMKKHRIDTQWFLLKIEAAGYTMHSLAPKLSGRNKTLDYASLYNLIHGRRAMSLLEAYELAEALDLPLEEIARRALGKRR